MQPSTTHSVPKIHEQPLPALDDATRRMNRIAEASDEVQVSCTRVGKHDVATWILTNDPKAPPATGNRDGLSRMKPMAHREQGRIHHRDLIDLRLAGSGFLPGMPEEPAARPDQLLTEQGG